MALSSSRLKNDSRLRAAEANGNQAIGKAEKDKDAVALLQSCMLELGFKFGRSLKPSGRVDGIFGDETESIIKRFQKNNGLKPDGLVGPKTLKALDLIYIVHEQADRARLTLELRSPASGWHMT
jgi:peptidoglycan hydrolase-like protein with peptidoglycan-binding domain